MFNIGNHRLLIASLINKQAVESFHILENFHQLLFDLPFKTTNASLYQIKLQWYLDAIKNPAPSGVPTVDEFKKLAKTYNFSLTNILTFITAYNINADTLPFKSVRELVSYAKNTEGALWKFYMQVCQVTDSNVLQLIEDIACFYGIIGILRNTDFYFRYHRFILIFQEKDVTNYQQVGQGNLKQILTTAKNLLQKINKQQYILPKNIKPILLLSFVAKSYLKQLQKIGANYKLMASVQFSKIDDLKILLKILFHNY
ncbi:squalene/phytoene synthase family protein [Candidatus Hepatincola sp. Pdp]